VGYNKVQTILEREIHMAKLFKGDWVVPEIAGGALPQRVATGFGQCNKKRGVRYTPILYLGSQLVEGTNHAILCTARPAVKDPTTELVIVYLHEALPESGSLLGEFEFLSSQHIDLGI
jgi:hypothetical protein